MECAEDPADKDTMAESRARNLVETKRVSAEATETPPHRMVVVSRTRSIGGTELVDEMLLSSCVADEIDSDPDDGVERMVRGVGHDGVRGGCEAGGDTVTITVTARLPAAAAAAAASSHAAAAEPAEFTFSERLFERLRCRCRMDDNTCVYIFILLIFGYICCTYIFILLVCFGFIAALGRKTLASLPRKRRTHEVRSATRLTPPARGCAVAALLAALLCVAALVVVVGKWVFVVEEVERRRATGLSYLAGYTPYMAYQVNEQWFLTHE